MQKTTKVNVLGANIHNLTMDEAVNFALNGLFDNKKQVVYTPNSEIIMQAYEDKSFLNILNSADLTIPDGIGVVYASRILKNPIKERVAGFDFINELFKKIKDTNHTVFLLGSAPNVAFIAKEKIKSLYEGINIVGTHDGYFKDDDGVINYINESSPDILLVCLGAPKQEKWIYNNKDKIKSKLFIGAGGSLDVFAGVVKRAPKIWQDLGLEWLYRLLKQPSRFVRMLNLPKFLLTVIFKGKRRDEG